MKKIFGVVLLLWLSCLALPELSAAPVQRPELLTQLRWTGTSWFGSPIIHDLGVGSKKLIGTPAASKS